MRSHSEKRQRPRFAASKGHPRLLADGYDVSLVDFSSTGLRVEVTHRLNLGAVIQISGEIEGSAEPIPIGGRCRVC